MRLVELTGGALSRRARSPAPPRSRRDPPRQGARPAGVLRRVDQPPDAQRERHRRLPHLLQALAAAALRGRPQALVAALADGTIDVIVSATIRRTSRPSACPSRRRRTARSGSRRCFRRRCVDPKCPTFSTRRSCARARRIRPSTARGWRGGCRRPSSPGACVSRYRCRLSRRATHHARSDELVARLALFLGSAASSATCSARSPSASCSPAPPGSATCARSARAISARPMCCAPAARTSRRPPSCSMR
jgi:hypothetical protein